MAKAVYILQNPTTAAANASPKYYTACWVILKKSLKLLVAVNVWFSSSNDIFKVLESNGATDWTYINRIRKVRRLEHQGKKNQLLLPTHKLFNVSV